MCDTALNLVGEFGHGVETEHAYRAGSLMHMHSRIVEHCDILLALAEGGERGESPHQRLVDLASDADQRAEVEVANGLVRDAGRGPGDLRSAAPSSGAVTDHFDGGKVAHWGSPKLLSQGVSRLRLHR